MKKWRSCGMASAILAMGFVIGGTCGWFGAREVVGREMFGSLYSEAATSAQLDALVLQKIREGETSTALKLLETRLDGNLITIAGMSDEFAPEKTEESVYTAIEYIRTYRSKYPQETHVPQVEAALSKALSLKRPSPHTKP